jgi:predicted phosphodiesterase
MYSILHITDLHRAKNDPISNSELLSALISDRECYEREIPPIRMPDAIVVSGDVIQGVPLNHANYESDLAAQYRVAHDFLVSLADRFLKGDRTKIIIVPGNHDIDWNVAFSSMVAVEPDSGPSNIPAALFEPGSPYRWDWKNQCLYKVQDNTLYDQRLAAFWEFFENFYSGHEGMLRVAPWSDANLYSLDEGRIGIAAFNSCVGNDCFAFHGEISRQAVAQAHLDLKDLGPWRLRIAVWHHDIEGPPHRTDYMDIEVVRGMIGRGFRLGLYGHQHKVQITPQHARLLDEETMVLASAGSLCAGRRELPMGALRGYSIIEIRDDYSGARVHIREMRIANLFSRAILRDFEGRSYVDLEWTTPLDAAGRPENPVGEARIAIMRKAEDALHEGGDAAETLQLLLQLDEPLDAFGRRLLLAAAGRVGPLKVIEMTGAPKTIEELVNLIDAYSAIGDLHGATSAINDHAGELSLPKQIQSDLEARIQLKKRAMS